MNDPLDTRVTKLEFRVDGHEVKITAVKEETTVLSKNLQTITDNMKQIKWLAVGGALVYAWQTDGPASMILKYLF